MFRLGEKIFGVALLLAILFIIGRWLWHAPQTWNPVAKGLYTHVGKLRLDSARWYKDSTSLRADIYAKGAVIDTLRHEISTAQTYAEDWKSQFQSQVALSDAASDKLTDRQAELDYYKKLVANGTLSAKDAGNIQTLLPANPLVIRAGDKTANREAMGQWSLDSLNLTVGLVRARNQRLKQGLESTGVALTTASNQVRASIQGGIYPFNHKRRKQARQIAKKLDSLSLGVSKLTGSDLETILNKP